MALPAVMIPKKNLFDVTAFVTQIKILSPLAIEVIEDGFPCIKIPVEGGILNFDYKPINGYKLSQQYTLTYDVKCSLGTAGARFAFVYFDGTKTSTITTNAWMNTVTVSDGKSVSKLGITYSSSVGSPFVYIRLDTIQLEEGTTQTEYEPYTLVNPKPHGIPLSDVVLREVNGVKDEVVGNELIQRVKEYVLQSADIKSVGTSWVNIDFAIVKVPSDSVNTAPLINYVRMLGYSVATEPLDSTTNIGKYSTASSANRDLMVIFAKGTTLEQARQALVGTTLNYQLQTPIITPIYPRPPIGINRKDIVIRELPNGVKDEVVGNDFVQRVSSEYVIDENYGLSTATVTDLGTVYRFARPGKTYSNFNIGSEVLRFSSGKTLAFATYSVDSEHVYYDPTNKIMHIYLNKALIDPLIGSTPQEKLQTYITGNQALLTYQLATPIVTPIYPKQAKPNVKNIVQNGNFADGVNGWSATTTNISVSNNVLSVLANSVSQCQQELNVVAGRKYYVLANMKATSTLVGVSLGGAIIKAHSGNNQFEKLSFVYSVSTSAISTIRLRDERVSNWDAFYVKEVLAIDLTKTFSAGKEPTKEQCDILFADWFDGGKYMQELATAKR